MNNAYDILECNGKSSFDEIKKQYHKLLLKYHPDKATQETSKFHQLQAGLCLSLFVQSPSPMF